jgi:hypothetical protein
VTQEVAQAQGCDDFLGASRAMGCYVESESKLSGRIEFGGQHERPQVNRGVRPIGAAAEKRPRRAGQKSGQGFGDRDAAITGDVQGVLDGHDPGGSGGGDRLGLDPIQAGGGDRGESGKDFGRLDRLAQFEFEDLASALDAQAQCQSENDLGAGVETLARRHGKRGTAEHPFEAAHQVVMAD